MKQLFARLQSGSQGPFLVEGRELLALFAGVAIINWAISNIGGRAISRGAIVDQGQVAQAFHDGLDHGARAVVASPGVYGLQVQDPELADRFRDVVVEGLEEPQQEHAAGDE